MSRRLGKVLTWERKRCRDQRTSQGGLGRRRAGVGQGSSAAVGGADEINANQPEAISPRHIQSRTGALRDPESSGFCGYFAQFSGFSALQGWTRRSSLASNQAAQATLCASGSLLDRSSGSLRLVAHCTRGSNIKHHECRGELPRACGARARARSV